MWLGCASCLGEPGGLGGAAEDRVVVGPAARADEGQRRGARAEGQDELEAVVLDEDAASDLTRFDTPWLVKDCVWDEKQIKKAVIWLSNTINKPILKLTEEDYNNNGMAQLAVDKGPAYNINIHIFNKIQHTITGWPGGKPNADDTQRPERAEPAQKNVLIFSPHPDDDVISMGGTFSRLADQGHEVHVAYQTSGNTAVWSDDTLRFIEFARDLSKSMNLGTEVLEKVYSDTRNFLESKKPNQADINEIFDRNNMNVAGFHLETNSRIGYAMIDIDQGYNPKVVDELRNVQGANKRKTRILY